ncbi:MAG: hypothetical protein A2992_01670 [Elusimicrobia bacterium RIFCSPLOWO2_01_FULL_59_12]|nr:MAG: hypothetical protein A2992_01670 [Elusimicrobia bacterium RIFCSPLOWO2_01_FULL_59_12]
MPYRQLSNDGVGDVVQVFQRGNDRGFRSEVQYAIEPLAVTAQRIRQTAAPPAVLRGHRAFVGANGFLDLCDELIDLLGGYFGFGDEDGLVTDSWHG